MASIQGFTEAQNAALANASVGSLILLYHPPLVYRPTPANEDGLEVDGESEGDEEDEEDEEDEDDEDEECEDEDDDEDDGGDGEVTSQEAESTHQTSPQSGSVRPTIESATRATLDLVDIDHAEHIEYVDLSEPVANGNIEDGSNHRADLLTAACTISVVTQVTKDLSGTITDLHVVGLEYKSRPVDEISSYQLYGNQCSATMPSKPANTASEEFADYTNHISREELRLSIFPDMPDTIFTVDPAAEVVRDYLHGGVCPADCDEGYLASIDQLHGMVKDYTVPTSKTDVRAICPSCIGIDLMKEHQSLRVELENFLQVASFESVLDFYGRLAPRRQQLGYEYEQFDEREWNFLFEDMISEDEGERSEGEFEPWDAANDPNADVVPRPAPQATMDSLQANKYADVKVDDDSKCPVCCELFRDEQLVVRLACKHIFCKGDCILEWLKNDDSCPLCRAKVSVESVSNAANENELLDADEEPDKDVPEAYTSMPGVYGNW